MARDNSVGGTGLPENHPLIKFARNPEDIESILNLDDAVIWGAASMMAEAKDSVIRNFACRLRDRKLFKCIDVVESPKCPTISGKIAEWKRSEEKDGPRILIDQATREPYKDFQESKGPLNQIMIRTSSNTLVDVAQLSNVVKGIETFTLFRVYVAREDNDAQLFLKNVISSEGT